MNAAEGGLIILLMELTVRSEGGLCEIAEDP